MDPYKCPECDSLRVRIEFHGMLSQDAEGREERDEMTYDVSADGYAECLECNHSGISEDFEQ